MTHTGGALLAGVADDDQLVAAKIGALTRQVPLLYLAVVLQMWVTAFVFGGDVSGWLAIGAPVALTVVAAVRLLAWRRRAGSSPKVGALIVLNVFAVLVSVALIAWGVGLYLEGSPLQRGYLLVTLSNLILGSMVMTIHTSWVPQFGIGAVGGAALLASVVVAQSRTQAMMAVSAMVGMLGVGLLVQLHRKNFAGLVEARIEARRRDKDQQTLLRMVEDMPVAVMIADAAADFRITYMNESSRELLRQISHVLPVPVEELIGAPIDMFHRYPEEQREVMSDPSRLPYVTRVRIGPELAEIKISAIMSEGEYVGPMLAWEIVTEKVAAEERIKQLAHYDALTGLPNRETFRERLDAVLASDSPDACVLFLDLDGFKNVNDTLGHHIGDELIVQVAQRLEAACGPEVVIGRLGGDEFTILLPCKDRDRAESLARQLIAEIRAPFSFDKGRHARIGTSVGIAFAPLHGLDSDTLFARADIALYAAKANGKGTFVTFSGDLEEQVQDRLYIEGELAKALDSDGDVFVYYQDIVDLKSDQVVCREALVRWHHETMGWVSPAVFIPVAEQSNLIDRVGSFVLHQACHDAAKWSDGAAVAVNVSGRQLGNGTLVSLVLSALEQSQLSAERLEIEVTETALFHDSQDGALELRTLRDLGVRVALDDFGTGFSSLAHLRKFPFDKIKIDGSFVRDAVDRPDCAAVVRAVAELGHRLNVTTVAEGVETREVLERIIEEGCMQAQGYLYSVPQPNPDQAERISQLA